MLDRTTNSGTVSPAAKCHPENGGVLTTLSHQISLLEGLMEQIEGLETALVPVSKAPDTANAVSGTPTQQPLRSGVALAIEGSNHRLEAMLNRVALMRATLDI